MSRHNPEVGAKPRVHPVYPDGFPERRLRAVDVARTPQQASEGMVSLRALPIDPDGFPERRLRAGDVSLFVEEQGPEAVVSTPALPVDPDGFPEGRLRAGDVAFIPMLF